METLFLALLLAVMGVTNIVCFVIGAKVGQRVQKGEDIKMPSVNPLQAVREREAKREAKREQEKLDTILRNIERYDGTPRGQEDVPR
jgi:hypothetical protein